MELGDTDLTPGQALAKSIACVEQLGHTLRAANDAVSADKLEAVVAAAKAHLDQQRRERCETCRFWERTDDSSGRCRRYPPGPDIQWVIGRVLNARDILLMEHSHDEERSCPYDTEMGSLDEIIAVWPVTDSESWCGEWRPQFAEVRT